MDRKKILIFIGVALLVIIVIAIFVYSLTATYTENETIKKETPQIDTLAAAPNYESKELKEADKIEISGFEGSVRVNNFFKLPKSTDPKYGDIIILSQGSGYLVFYSFEGNYFRINVSASPYKANRTKAEEALFKALDITREQSCQLPSEVQVLAYNDPNSNKVANFRINGCPDALELNN